MQTAVAKSGTIQITGMDGTPANTTYTITATSEAGETHAVSVAGVTDATATATALKNAWNNDASAYCTGVTATSNTDTVTLLADTAGVPFNVASSVAGGTGTIGAYTAVAANKGAADYNSADNWSTGAVPTASDSVVIPEGSGSILYGLDQSGTSINGFRVENGYEKTSQIGGTDGGYLKITLDNNAECYINGQGRIWLDLGASATDVVVDGTFTPSTGQYGLELKGTAIDDLVINGGTVGIGIPSGDLSKFDDLYVNSTNGTAVVTIGAGVTDTTSGSVTINQSGGIVVAWCTAASLTRVAGTYTQADGVITTATIYGPDPVYLDSDGTYTTVTLAGDENGVGGNIETRTILTKTITTLNVKSAKSRVWFANGSLAVTNAIDFDQVSSYSCTLNFGSNKTLTLGAS